MTSTTSAAAQFRAAAERLRSQVAHWTAPRYAVPASTGTSKADVLRELVQVLADFAADAEGQPRRTVPRVEPDVVLPDQVRVIAADLLAARPPAEIFDRATTAITTTARALD